MRKTIAYIILALAALAVIGLLVYEIVFQKKVDSSNITRALLILAGLGLTAGKIATRTQKSMGNLHLLYEKEYGELIGNAFLGNPKAKNRFYKALDDYNGNRYADAIRKLEKLMEEFPSPAERFTLHTFMGLCYREVGVPFAAIQQYEAAKLIRVNSTVCSNLGMCYLAIGKTDEAIAAYSDAIDADPKNPYAYNNLATLYIREGDYGKALEYANMALSYNATMSAALNALTISHAMLGNVREYEDAYRRAVAAGSNGARLKEVIRDLQKSDTEDN